MMPIFNYKPVEMLDKLEKLLVQEFDKISHYDLMFYAEMTRDMLTMYEVKDSNFIKLSLCEKVTAEGAEESKSEAAPEIKAADDFDTGLLAMLEKSSKKKKGKKVAAAKPSAAAAKKEEVAEIPKEERNRLDRA
jgi:glycogen synthase